MKKQILLIIAFLCTSLISFAQNKVNGIVTDQNSIPLEGVAVVIKGTTDGVVTNSKGEFSLNVPDGKTIVFSCLGLVDKEITAAGQKDLTVAMSNDNLYLDDVVVIGYGTSKKSDLTGSVATIKKDDLKNTKIGNASSALQGMAAGVQVTVGDMKPGADAGIIIRGVGSVNAGSGPLVLVDGVPASLQDVAPNDIASIEILKDASSAAIYGSRGSNGVVLITTKRGEEGSVKVNLNIQGGIQQMLNKQEVLNAQEYYDIVNLAGQAYRWSAEELRLISAGQSTDWQDAITTLGSFQNYNMSVTAGSGRMKNYFGIDYYDNKGIVRNSSFNRLNLRYNTDIDVNDWFRTGARVNFITSTLYNVSEESDSLYGTMYSAFAAQPTGPVYASNGEYFDGFLNTRANPVAMVELLNKRTNRLNVIGSMYLEFEPVKGLVFRSENTVNKTSHYYTNYEDGRMGQHYPKEGRATLEGGIGDLLQSENTVTYNFESGVHKGSVMGGFSASRQTYEGITAVNKGLNPITNIYNVGGAEDWGPNSSWGGANTLASFYTRLNYNFNDKLLATFTMRADGSSRFAPGHRWGYFPSAALAWRISEEDFLKHSSVVNNLKLRLSAGRLGNQNIGDYAYQALVSDGGAMHNYVLGGAQAVGSIYTSIYNPDLTWEKANQLDLGLDFGLYKGRISGTLETYYKRTSDLLWTVPLPYESGYTSSLTNVGKLDNYGVEFTLNTVNVQAEKFQWSSSFNFTWNHNNVVELYDGKTDVGKWIFVGHSLSEFYSLRSLGIWQLSEASEAARYGAQPGDRKIDDVDDNGIINGDDRQFNGYSTPQFYGGFTNTFNIGNFDLTIFMNYAGGYKINNSLLRFMNSYNLSGNMGKDYYNNYWTLDRPSNIYPAPRIGSQYSNGDGTDANYEDGGFLRIKNVELGYNIPNKVTNKIGVANIRFYVAVQNLYTFTKFTGYDVEAWDKSNTYPGARAYIGGLSFSF